MIAYPKGNFVILQNDEAEIAIPEGVNFLLSMGAVICYGFGQTTILFDAERDAPAFLNGDVFKI